MASWQREWAAGLSGLSNRQIATGLDGCRRELTWPPSIAEFLKLAKAGNWHHGDAYKPVLKALPKPRADGEVVKRSLSAMREALGRG